MIPTKDEARAILEPYYLLIAAVIEESWAEWKALRACQIEKGFGPPLYSRTIANNIFDGIARRAILKFGVDPKVRVEIEAQTFKLHFKGLTARFKKGGDDKLGSNIPTLAATLFEDAGAMFPGMPPENGKVEFIWLPNELWTDLNRILVIARDGDRLIWEYDIERAAPVAGITPLTPPIAPEGPAPILVTPKPQAKPDTQEG